MPLIKGYSDRSRQKNIDTLIAEGRTPEQASAIAYRIQREQKKKRAKARKSKS